MRVMMAHDRDPGSSLVSFGEVVSRDPFFLIGHCEAFALAKVTQLRFATVSDGTYRGRAYNTIYAKSESIPKRSNEFVIAPWQKITHRYARVNWT